MSTWFSNLKDLSKDLTAKVQAAIPKIDNETLQKLTLSTPELKAEREALQQEYCHKVAVKDSLAHMYPWETRDDERDILVEECKEAILGLSHSVETFFGPYQMPLLNVNTEEDDEEDDIDTKEELDDEVLEEGAENAAKKLVKDMNPTPESLEKLSKLEPLPPLLSNFDLLAHVGLIQKMLKVDKKLVERQSTLSGGGEREKVFWKNYFFHCAYTRYEAGLSIDEIWSDEPLNQPSEKSLLVVPSKEAETKQSDEANSFRPSQEDVPSSVVTIPEVEKSVNGVSETAISESPPPEYEVIEANDNYDDGDDDDADGNDAFGGELDELEAEIAQALDD